MENSILYSEVSCVCIIVLFLLSIKLKRSVFIQTERRVLYMVMVTNIAFFVLDAVWIFINKNGIGITIVINWLLNGAYFILSGVIGFLWFNYSETVQKSKYINNKKYIIMGLIPIVTLTILTLLSFKTKWIFYIDADNVYHRGPVYPLQLLCAYGYVIFTAVKALHLSLHAETYHRMVELRTLFMFVVPTLIAGTLQVIIPGYPILCVGNTFGILYVFLTQQEHLISVDPLTKLNNRNQLFQYLSTKFSHHNENRTLYLLLMDVDYFKSINDHYGHVEGDQALKKVASCLMKVCIDRHYFISRYGGDEFIMICDLEANDSIQNVRDAIQNEIANVKAPYKLSLSIGYAKYTPKIKSHQDFISKADAELYKVKKSRRQK